MGLFKKRKTGEESTPELPELPKSQEQAFLQKSELPDVPSGLPKIETQTLPILPDYKAEKKLNQEAIKYAITESKTKILDSQLRPSLHFYEREEPVKKRIFEMPVPTLQKNSKKETEPIFIRLDKFQVAVETFEEIKKKVSEIEELLKKTREIKIEEEEELAEWEKEIQIIKSRMDLIDRNIFNKLD